MRLSRTRTTVVVAGGVGAAVGATLLARRLTSIRVRRNLDLARLGLDVGTHYASTAARKVFASAERRDELDRERELKTAEAVADRLGNMKGALMKLGQMASYVHEGLPEPLRAALSQLQSNAPPMSGDLAAEVIERELGGSPDRVFVEWDPVPLASASIGQVHRAVVFDPTTRTERAVAVKVQYPGVGEAIAADLRNVDFLGTILKQGFGALDPSDLVDEIRSRITEELDYRLEARNQQLFADHYAGHPFIFVPAVLPHLSTGQVLTTELATGSTWKDLLTWDQHEHNLAGETLFRFMSHSLYGLHAFNGDPHPGNYLFHGDGRVTFFDFGLVKHFTSTEMNTFIAMVRAAAYDRDSKAFRRVVEDAGMLRRDAPVTDTVVGDYFSQFYANVRTDEVVTWSSDYANGIVSHMFDRNSPIAQYATVPKQFVFIQRINLGLYALLGELKATANYRRIAEELWPFVQGPASTELGERERPWLEKVSSVDSRR